MNAKLDANLGILPKRSQIFVVVLTLLSGVAFLVGCAFLWNEKVHQWIPLSFSILFGIGAGIAWFASHKNTDLQDSIPTRLNINNAGVQLETDSRTLSSVASFKQLEQLLATLGHRAPLPEPDGMVSPSGVPMPERKDEAINETLKANAEAELGAKEAACILSNSGSAQQEYASQPLIIGPEDINVHIHNIADCAE